jgi:dTDP-4-amino-4,6-dideoxygalactose transaminase
MEITGLCNVDAAIALKQLRKLDSLLRVRIERKKELDKRVSDLWTEQITLPASNGDSETSLNVATKYVFRFRDDRGFNGRQQRYRQALLASGIELQNLYEPIHQKSKHVPLEHPLVKTESVSGQLLQIPLEPSMARREFEFVIKTVDEVKNCLH